MDSGSWFAIWAMWRRISFFVITPRRRLQKERQKEEHKFTMSIFDECGENWHLVLLPSFAGRSRWDFCTTLFSEMAWIGVLTQNQILALILDDSNLRLGNRQLTVSGLEKGRECGRLLRTGNATLFLWADSTYTVRSKCCETEVKQSEWTISSTHSGLGEQESEVNFPTQIQEHI